MMKRVRLLMQLFIISTIVTITLIYITWQQSMQVRPNKPLHQADEGFLPHNGFHQVAHMGVRPRNQSQGGNRFGVDKYKQEPMPLPRDAPSFGDVPYFGHKKSDLYPVKGTKEEFHQDGQFEEALRDREVLPAPDNLTQQEVPASSLPPTSASPVVPHQVLPGNHDRQTGYNDLTHDKVKVAPANVYPTRPRPRSQPVTLSTPMPVIPEDNNGGLNKEAMSQGVLTQEDVKKMFTKMPLFEGENVISMTLYGSSLRYTMGAIRNAELAKENFPGWKVRIYTEAPSDHARYGVVPQTVVAHLRSLGADIHYMQPGEDFIPPMMWRFLVADDLWVSRFIVRDSDARLSERDAATVSAWVRSGQPFHCVRDHPSHASYAVSGGMWGGQPQQLRNILRRSWKDLMRGGTCWLGDQVTASGTTVVLPSGTPNCPILCRCPARYIYEREQLNTHAECHLSCASSLRLSPEILRKYYSGSNDNNNPLNWRKKREAEMAANQKK